MSIVAGVRGVSTAADHDTGRATRHGSADDTAHGSADDSSLDDLARGGAHDADHDADQGPGQAVAAPAPARTPRTLSAAGDLLRALAAPVRIAIVLQLRESSRCVHDLVDALGVTQPLISQHLRVLKSAGVVHGVRHGREVYYALVDDHLGHIVLDAVEHVEEGR